MLKLVSQGGREAGFSLIELMIGLSVLAIVMMIGLPSMGTWVQNTQIRTSAETMYSGLQLARAEALKRNSSVRFQLVSTLDSSCALSTSGKHWIVSQTDPTGACEVSPSESTAPLIIQKRDGNEGTTNVNVAATGASSVIFNGLGRVSGTGISQINFTNPTAGTCQSAGGTMRCLRIVVTTGGQVRMCDPAVGDTADPRYC